jgi:peptide/nickel transport system substrate-binding protein
MAEGVNRVKGQGVRSVLAGLATAALLVTACGGGGTKTATGPAATTATAGASKVLNIAMWSAPDGFNPVTASTGYDTEVIGLLFDTLDWQSPDQTFHPLLAQKWDVSQDGKTFTFHLDPAAKWTDGQPVTAADVAYTLQMNADPKVPAVFGSFLALLQGTNDQGQNVDPSKPLAGVKVIDDHTVQLLTKNPTDPNVMLYDIGDNIPIIPQHALQGVSADEFAKAPFFQNPTVTDGPYKFVKYVTSQYVQLAANPDYHLGKPKVDTLFIKIVPPTSVLAELRDGEVDVTAAPGIGDVPLQDWDSVKSLPNVKQDPVPGLTNQFMMINVSKPYLKDATVRQAITMAINRQEIVDQLLKGLGSVAVGPVNPIYKYADKNLKPYPYDPNQAKAMLQAAHFPFNQQLVLLVPTGNQIRMQSAPLIQQNLQAIGLNVRIQQYDFGTMLSEAKKGNFDFMLIGSGCGADPSSSSIFFSCQGTLNYGKFCDPVVDQAYQAGLATADTAARQAAYTQLQEELYKQAPFVFLYYADGLMAYNTRINDAAVPNAYGMQQAWLWDVK